MLRNEKIGQYEVLQAYGDQIAIVKDTTFEAADTFLMTISDHLELLEIKSFDLPGFPQLLNQFQWKEKACFIYREFDGCHLDTIPYDVDYSVDAIRDLCLSIHRIWKLSNECFYPNLNLEELYLTKEGDLVFRNAYNFAFYQKCSEESITKQLAYILYQMVTGRNQLIDIRLFDPSFSYILNSTIVQCAKGETSLELEAFATTLMQYNETDQMVYQQDKSLRPPRRRKNSFIRYMPDFDHLEFHKVTITHEIENIDKKEETKDTETGKSVKEIVKEDHEIKSMDSGITSKPTEKIEKVEIKPRDDHQEKQKKSTVTEKTKEKLSVSEKEEAVQDRKEENSGRKVKEKNIEIKKQNQDQDDIHLLKDEHRKKAEKIVDGSSSEKSLKKEGNSGRSGIPKPKKTPRQKPEASKLDSSKERGIPKQENKKNTHRDSSWNHSFSKRNEKKQETTKVPARDDNENKDPKKKIPVKKQPSAKNEQKKNDTVSVKQDIQEKKPVQKQEKIQQKQPVLLESKNKEIVEKIEKVKNTETVISIHKDQQKVNLINRNDENIETEPKQQVIQKESSHTKNESQFDKKPDDSYAKPVIIQEEVKKPEVIIERTLEDKAVELSKDFLNNEISNNTKSEKLTQTDHEQTMDDFLKEYELETGKKLRQPIKIYIPKQVKMAIIGCSIIVISIIGIFVHKTRQQNKYNDMIEVVERSTNHNEKIKTLQNAIKMLPKESKAYEKLLDVYLDDAVFSSKEESAFLKVIHKNWDKVKKGDGYGDLAYEIGKAYWYYYQYDNMNNEEITRMKSAVQWFQDSMKYKSTKKYHRIAKIYCEIGKFNQEITLNVKEGTDKGVYKKYYKNLKNLLEIGNSNTVASLELYKLTVNSIDTYHERFIDDGIDEEEINQTKQDVLYKVNETSVVTEKEKELKNEILYGNK